MARDSLDWDCAFLDAIESCRQDNSRGCDANSPSSQQQSLFLGIIGTAGMNLGVELPPACEAQL